MVDIEKILEVLGLVISAFALGFTIASWWWARMLYERRN